jgi:hypothetical protein
MSHHSPKCVYRKFWSVELRKREIANYFNGRSCQVPSGAGISMMGAELKTDRTLEIVTMHGPNVKKMTLRVEGQEMPVLRISSCLAASGDSITALPCRGFFASAQQ